MWIWCSLFLALQEGDKKFPIPQEPIKNWKSQHFEKIKDQEVLIAELAGDEMTPVNVEKKIFDVTGLRATYYTQPKAEGERSQRLFLTADRARFDGEAKKIHLLSRARGEAEDGTKLESAEFSLDMEKKQLATDGDFLMRRPGMILTGRGLRADDTLRQATIEREPWIEVSGRPGRFDGRLDDTLVTRLYGKGPMTIVEKEKKTIVQVSNGVILEVVDEKTGAMAWADEGELIFRKEKERVELEKATARKNLRMLDSNRTEVEAGEFAWDQATETGTIVGNPSVNRDGSRVKSRTVHVDRKNKITRFVGDVQATMMAGEKEPRPIPISADELIARVENVEAIGNVRISGLTEAKGQPATARCESFLWDPKTQEGVLRGGPWVNVEMGPHRFQAARILAPGAQRLVLQGPKRILLVQENEPTFVTSSGDIAVDAGVREIKMVDRCLVLTKDSRMSADRIDVRLSADGKGVESIRAAGHIEVQRPSEGVRLFGDRMRAAGPQMALRGTPFAVLDQPSLTATMDEIRMDPKTRRVEAFRGRERIKIRITEEIPR